MKKISVVIPIYNGEKYIKRCVDSVLNQKYFDIKLAEILLLDDGSEDSSEKIIKDFSKRYPKIIMALSHKNMGVAKTRDKGIERAKGEYIIFIDQDDYIDPDYFKRLLAAVERGNYDIAICGFKRPGTGFRIINKNIKLKNKEYAKYICTGVFAKIHKSSFLKEKNIKSYHTTYGEDIGFILHEYASTKKITVVENYAGYNWSYNKTSVSNTEHKELLVVLPMLIKMLDKIKLYDTHTDEYEYYILQTIVAYLLWAGRLANRKDFKIAYSKVFKWVYANYPHINHNKYVYTGPSGSPKLTRSSIGIFMILHKLKLISLFSLIYCKGK